MRESVLVWNGKSSALYREARRFIAGRTGGAPQTAKAIDFEDFFTQHPSGLIYFPVFQGMSGWWGEMLGTDARIQSKMVLSPECILYEIGMDGAATSRQLFAAEILPHTLKKVRDSKTEIKDMIATDTGTILALFCGGAENKIRAAIKTYGGTYMGHLGGY